MSEHLAPLEGFIDSVDRTLIRGWAYDGSDVGIDLQVFGNDALLGMVVADEYRGDLEVLGNGHHAFSFVIAGGLPAGRTAISVRRAADGALLGNSPFNVEYESAPAAEAEEEPAESAQVDEAWTALEGYIDSVDMAGVRGWARDGSGRHVRLRVSGNDTVLGVVTADVHREDLETNGVGDGRYAFEFVFAGGPPPGRVAIRVVRDGDDAEIGNSPFNIDFPLQAVGAVPEEAAQVIPEISPPAIVAPVLKPPVAPVVAPVVAPGPARAAALGELKGRIEVVGRDLVRGWAFDAPASRVSLRIFANDVPLGSVIADGYRDDLEARGQGDGRHGFVFIVPGGLPPGRIAITVKRAQDGASIGNSPFFVDFD